MGILLLSKPSIALYEGIVASRARMFIGNGSPGNKQTQCRSAHVATENLSAIRICFAGFSNGGNIGGPITDTGNGGATTITAGIEYPAGTFTQVKFSGSASGSIPDVGTLWSDYATVSVPSGATFWVRNLRTNASGIFFNGWQNATLGEATEVNASGLTDKTVSGTIVDSGNGWSVPPLAITAMTNNASAVIIGDSLAAGTGDTEAASRDGKVGVIARSLGNIPFVNIGRGSATAQSWASQAIGANAVIQKSSHLIVVLGSNDINGFQTKAQVISSLQSVAALARSGQKVYICTMLPRQSVASDDDWATLAGQHVDTAFDAVRVPFNTDARAIIAGTTGTYDIAAGLESSLNSGKWIAATPKNTIEGVHPTPVGYLLLASAGLITPVTWP